MKNILLSLCTLVLFTTFSLAQCSKFYPFSKGATSTLTLYNEKGKTQGTITYQVLSVSSTTDGEKASVTSSFKDEKGKEITTTNYDAYCKNGTVSIDFNSMLRPEMTRAFGGGDIKSEITGVDIDVPNNLSVGQKLKDAEMKMKMSMSGMNFNMNTFITDREVVAKETITTPAGTFECYVIFQNTVSEGMAGSMKRSSKQWFAEGVGVVKTEDYDKKGNLDGSGILTSFSK